MKVSSIKLLIDNYSITELKTAENTLMNEESLQIKVEGKDEGEQLTHILAAIFCKEEISNQKISVNQAIRLFSQRVRNSIN